MGRGGGGSRFILPTRHSCLKERKIKRQKLRSMSQDGMLWIAWPVPSAKIQIETIGFLLLPRGTTQHTCSTRRALFSLGNSLEKGRERRQQHVRPVDGGCRGSSRKQHRDISVFLTSESVGPAGLSQQSGCLSSQEILPRVVTIQALALLTLKVFTCLPSI